MPSGSDILAMVVCLVFVGVIFMTKSKKHAMDHHIRLPRKRDDQRKE